jgi:tetratricopeptide (TPR) repeat protein
MALNILAQEDDTLILRVAKTIRVLEKGDYEASLKSFNQIIKEAEESDNHEALVVVLLNKGLLYYRLNESDKALDLYFEALEIAQEYKFKRRYNSIYNNIGIVYSINKNYQKAREFFYKALNISKELKDTLRIGINELNIANLDADFGMLDSAHQRLIEPEKHFRKLKMYDFLAALYSIKGNVYFDEQKYLLAKKSHQKALKYNEKRPDKGYESEFLIALGKSYLKLNDLDSAVIVLKKGLQLSKEIKHGERAIAAARLLGDVYSKSGKYNEAIELYKKSLSLKDSLLEVKSKEWVSESQMRYAFGKKEQEIKFLMRKNRLNLYIWGLSFFIVLVTGAFFIYSLRNRHIKAKQRNQILKKEKEVQQLELQKSEAENKCLVEEMKASEEISKMEQEKLQQEIDHKNRELASGALHVVSKNKILDDIKTQIQGIECQGSDISQDIRKIARLIDSNISMDDDWESFKLHFEQVNGEFFNKLSSKHSDLSQGDLRLCAYLYINLNAKEIAQIFNISPDSVRKRKQRLREKLQLDKDVELTFYLQKV